MQTRLLRPLLLVAVPSLAVAGALLWWLWGGRYVSTENAYVKADLVQVSADVAGRIVEVQVKDHNHVKTGDILIKIDEEPFKLALDKAEAELDLTRANVANLRLRCQRQGERVNASLNAQRQAVTKSVNPLNDGFYTALSAHDLQHETKDFLLVFGQCCSLYKYAVR